MWMLCGYVEVDVCMYVRLCMVYVCVIASMSAIVSVCMYV